MLDNSKLISYIKKVERKHQNKMLDNRKIIEQEIARLQLELEALQVLEKVNDESLLDDAVFNITFQKLLSDPKNLHLKQRSALRWDVIQVNILPGYRRGGHYLEFVSIRENVTNVEAVNHIITSNKKHLEKVENG